MYRFFVITLISFTFFACGGGSDGSSEPTIISTPTPASSPEPTAEPSATPTPDPTTTPSPTITPTPTPEPVLLTIADYEYIVSANKGSLAQLDDLVVTNAFDVEPGSDSFWTQEDIESAINALLYNNYDEPIGVDIDVVYTVDNGTGLSTRESTITVEEASVFDVIPYPSNAVSKSNPTKAYVHYMPWFESKDIDGFWGSHWTMANRNPDIIDNNRRQIASHYYPIIGPYSSNDPDLVDYHLILMKLVGLDGVLIDWYGTYDVNDYAQNLLNANALINKTADAGIEFGVVYEDRTTEAVVNAGREDRAVDAAISDFGYIRDQYFSAENYITIEEKPLLLTFTPVHIQTPAEWQEVLDTTAVDPVFLSIWGELSDLGSTGDGEYSWVYNGENDHLGRLTRFYQNEWMNLDYGIGSAYAGFKDFYLEGGWGDGIPWEIEHNGTNVLQQTLALASEINVPYVQFVTWNDFGEGTMLEPTQEFGYTFLEQIQSFTGVAFSVDDLEYVRLYYDLRKSHASNTLVQLQLDQAYYYFISLQLERAQSLIDSID